MGGLGRGVHHQLDLGAVLGEHPVHALGVADVDLERAEVRICALQALGDGGVDASGPKKRARMSFSSPITSKPALTK